MNLSEALDEVKYLLLWMEDAEADTKLIGLYARDAAADLRYLYEFAKTIQEVPTAHNQKAEMDHWDAFFEERKKLANAES